MLGASCAPFCTTFSPFSMYILRIISLFLLHFSISRLEVLGSVAEDCGTIGRESEELEKSSLDEHPEGNTGRVGFALESNMGRV